MLQQIAGRRIYAESGLWTTEVKEALSFDSTDNAVEFALKKQLPGVQILIHLDSAHMAFVVPCGVFVAGRKLCEA